MYNQPVLIPIRYETPTCPHCGKELPDENPSIVVVVIGIGIIAALFLACSAFFFTGHRACENIPKLTVGDYIELFPRKAACSVYTLWNKKVNAPKDSE